MQTPNLPIIRTLLPTWNKGRIVGQKRPLKPKHVWTIRVRLLLGHTKMDNTVRQLGVELEDALMPPSQLAFAAPAKLGDGCIHSSRALLPTFIRTPKS